MAFDWKPTKGVKIFLVVFVLIVLIGNISQRAENDRRATMTPEQRADEDAAKAKEKKLNYARTVCQIALEKILHDPDSAKLEHAYSWYAEERKDGTILVQPTGRAKNAFGAYIIGTWNCVTKPVGSDVVVLSLKQLRS